MLFTDYQVNLPLNTAKGVCCPDCGGRRVRLPLPSVLCWGVASVTPPREALSTQMNECPSGRAGGLDLRTRCKQEGWCVQVLHISNLPPPTDG